MAGRKTKVLIVSSVGGHLDEVMQLRPLLEKCAVSLVVNDQANLPEFPFERVYRITHAERNWKVLINFLEAASILRKEMPDLILSAGAGLIVPFAVLSRLTPAKMLFVESSSAVRIPTLSGRLVYPFSDDFVYQWPSGEAHFPKGRHIPVLFQ